MFKHTLSHTKKYALALTGAVVLASGAFAVGTQAGDGVAVAGGAGDRMAMDGPHRGGPFGRQGGAGLQTLADRLGVDAEKLRTALEKVRPQRRSGDRKGELTAALATGLKVPEGRVKAALDRVRPDRPREGRRGEGGKPRRGAFAANLARELDVETPAVQAILKKQREARRDALVTRLAGELGIPAEKVKEALPAARPFGGPGRRPGCGPGGTPS